MRKKDLQQFADRLEMAVNEVTEQAQMQNPRRRLSEELIPDAIHYLSARMNGTSAEDYARTHPQTFMKLWRAMGRE